MVSFGGVRTLQLFDLVTIQLTFDVLNFSRITIGPIVIAKKLKTSKVNLFLELGKSK